ncbi:RNA polymerase sigma factor [Maribellus maritimus]|uniref:RNA polymerase sigma factor n=1 Tax=Maribellus maritimus TaxID=2870838 RepID=UPI001EEA51FA|nr:sigma-70 family RNA polymerase sigma factor [Maribellus maritimus]MCG6189695.1 sigma-70 family RNA polymerase sigma factor [Maribellus maritimus]
MGASDEKKLLSEIKKNPQKFEIIYDQYFDRIFSYVLKGVMDYETAKDICSEIFIKAFISIRRFRWNGVPIIIWLFKISQNEIRLYFRNQKYRPRYLNSEYEHLRNQTSPGVEEEKIQVENRLQKMSTVKKLVADLNQLSENERDCISLKYIENLTTEEISQVLNLKTGTVKSHLSRGIEKLRKMQPKRN